MRILAYEYLVKLVEAIKDGYEIEIVEEPNGIVHLSVENPDFQEDDGSMPYLGIVVELEKSYLI